jgi:hypothetical protein
MSKAKKKAGRKQTLTGMIRELQAPLPPLRSAAQQINDHNRRVAMKWKVSGR